MKEPEIILKKLPHDINGILLCDDSRSKIYVNSDLNTAQKICTIVHELIHFYSYRDCNYYKSRNYYDICQCNWIENKIDKEVAKLMISDEVLNKKVIPYLESYSLSEIAEEIGVTENVLRKRLEKYELFGYRF